MGQDLVIKRVLFIVGGFIILGLIRSVWGADIWPVKPSKYYAEHVKADAEYNRRIHENKNMSPEEKKQLRNEVFAKSDKVFQEENIGLALRVHAVMSKLKVGKGSYLMGKIRKLASSKKEEVAAPVPKVIAPPKANTSQRNVTTGGGNVEGGGAEGISFSNGSRDNSGAAPSQPSGGESGGAAPISFK